MGNIYFCLNPGLLFAYSLFASRFLPPPTPVIKQWIKLRTFPSDGIVAKPRAATCVFLWELIRRENDARTRTAYIDSTYTEQ